MKIDITWLPEKSGDICFKTIESDCIPRLGEDLVVAFTTKTNKPISKYGVVKFVRWNFIQNQAPTVSIHIE